MSALPSVPKITVKGFKTCPTIRGPELSPSIPKDGSLAVLISLCGCFYSEMWFCEARSNSINWVILFQIAIPTFSVTLLKKTKTALLVPNALIIATVTDRVSACQTQFGAPDSQRPWAKDQGPELKIPFTPVTLKVLRPIFKTTAFRYFPCVLSTHKAIYS